MIEGRAATKTDGARFQALDGWRGICALLVVGFHAPVGGIAENSGVIRNAFLFVDFFFVLSGFVITHAFFEKLKAERAFGRFFLLRLFRVYPLHLFMLALYVAVECAMLAVKGPGEAFQGGTSIAGLIANLAMVHSLGVLDTLTWNYPSWSISAELVAYGLFGLAVVTVPRLIVPLCALAIVIGLPVIALVNGNMDASSNLGWLRCVAGFSLGVILRRAIWREEAGETARRHVISWSLAEAAAVLLLIVFVDQIGSTTLSVLAPLVFAFALYVFSHEGGVLSRGLKLRPIAFLGAVSYSIYMTHAFVIDRAINATSVLGRLTGWAVFSQASDGRRLIGVTGWQGDIALVMIVAATLVVSALTWRWVEQPGMALGRRLVSRRKPAAKDDGAKAAA
ncbi:acyltransferase [Jiella sp. MQZ9-1]|uniref:Acyltransferase n=1 Tax=Jiella flava TaxID=2816857 RepID=A0A939JT07_9HYPH|nr:acyltransferase [Jiella flava]MBO0661640.1 acyltransferase [Jiella flava]MCD2470282.1 acyltransferase [Jiella flava]